jgi:hypothetical protein
MNFALVKLFFIPHLPASMQRLENEQDRLRRELADVERQIKELKQQMKLAEQERFTAMATKEVLPVLNSLESTYSSLFFQCQICWAHFPCHIHNVEDMPEWWQDSQIEYPCGHSLCRKCYVKTLSWTELQMRVYYVTACPLCKKPKYVARVGDVDVNQADTQTIDPGSAMSVMVTPADDDDDLSSEDDTSSDD